MAGEYVELPVELIQHIQSFLDPKHAVRASALSKLWYFAWSTHPILSLNYYNNFYATKHGLLTKFVRFARTRIGSYQKLNQKLHTLKLILEGCNGNVYDEFTRLGDELILSALALGVNDLHVNIPYARYTLPDQVFSAICLKKLCFGQCEINLPQSNGKPRVLCSRLVSLELFVVKNLSDDMMRDILLGCPMMEDLRVDCCTGLKKINLSVIRCNLRTFHARTWSGLFVEWDDNCAPESRVNLQQQYHNFISLKLNGVKVDDLFFKLFSHRFPCLERLELEEYIGPVNNIDIASNSLRYLGLIRIFGLRVIKVQVPNIQNFRFESTQGSTEAIPSLSFHTASEGWKSDFKFNQQIFEKEFSWLWKISDTLTKLSLSKISLVLQLESGHLGSISARDIPSRPTSPFVENLEIQTKFNCPMSWCYGFLFGWLLCCRPKYITWINGLSGKTSYETIELVYNELKKNDNRMVTYTLPCIHGLELVDMEHYDKTLREWREWHPVQHGDKEVAAHGLDELDMEYYEAALRKWYRVAQGDKEAAHGEVKFRLRLKWTL